MTPISPSEFTRLMAPLGPWSAERRVAVAVSGGADSLCLAWLARAWGAPLALIVDHGLRAESAREAAETLARLVDFGVPSRILTLRGLASGPGLAARARAARYAALTEAARQAGLCDLLLGHHLRDQAETFRLRQDANSGPLGLAGMAAVRETAWLRLVRPLLAVPPGRLRATLLRAGLAWVEDPSNRDPAAHRARLRMDLDDATGCGARTAELAAASASYAARRRALEADIAGVLAQRVSLRPEGFAVLSPGAVLPEALAALIQTIAGAAYPPARDAVARLAAAPRPTVLGGVRFLPAGRLGPGWLVVREAAATAPPVAAVAGAVWDGRFRLLAGSEVPGATMGALGRDASRFRRHSRLPAAVLATLPALRHHGVLAEVPHIGYPNFKSCTRMLFSPAVPASGAPFLAWPGGMPTGATRPMLQGEAATAV